MKFKIDDDDMRALHAAVISAGLADQREALFARIDRGFISGIFRTSNPVAQILLDLDALARTSTLSDGSKPLYTWLDNAALLAQASGKAEAALFVRLRDQIRKQIVQDQIPSRGEMPPPAAPAGPQLTEGEVLDLLKDLLPSQFETLLIRLRIPADDLPPPSEAPATRAIAMIRLAKQSNRLSDLARLAIAIRNPQ